MSTRCIRCGRDSDYLMNGVCEDCERYNIDAEIDGHLPNYAKSEFEEDEGDGEPIVNVTDMHVPIAAPQDIINYMFAAWVKSGMYYKDFDRHVIDMMNGLMTRTLVCYGDEDDDNIGIIPLRAMLDRQVHSMRLKPLKIHRHGENIRYIPNIEEDYIHSPINEKILEQMEDLMAVALWGIMREEDNDDAAHWKAYKMSIGPIYSYNISDEMGGWSGGGCLTKEQLLGKYERAVEDMFNEFGEEK
jgi:hypothetical protein